MRNQGRAQKPQFLVLNNRQNKENSDTTNLPANKLKRDSLHPKLEKKISQQSTVIPSPEKNPNISQELKEIYSKLIADDYSEEIMDHMASKAKSLKGFLDSHSITQALRSKMVDWVIEVLSSYRMSQETFFRTIGIMDSYLLSAGKQELKDLHLIGLTSMFIAAKYQEIHPLKLSVMHDKIARKKFAKFEILQKEAEIVNSLGFLLEQVNLYDLVKHLLHEIDFNLEKASKSYLNQIALYLSKMSLFSSDLVQEKLTQLAGAVVFISLKTLEQADNCIDPEKFLTAISFWLKIQEEKMIEVSRKVLELAKTFSKVYHSLGNLKKFNKFQYHQE